MRLFHAQLLLVSCILGLIRSGSPPEDPSIENLLKAKEFGADEAVAKKVGKLLITPHRWNERQRNRVWNYFQSAIEYIRPRDLAMSWAESDAVDEALCKLIRVIIPPAIVQLDLCESDHPCRMLLAKILGDLYRFQAGICNTSWAHDGEISARYYEVGLESAKFHFGNDKYILHWEGLRLKLSLAIVLYRQVGQTGAAICHLEEIFRFANREGVTLSSEVQHYLRIAANRLLEWKSTLPTDEGYVLV